MDMIHLTMCLNLLLKNGYNINKQIRFKTSLLQSDLCDYSDAYIVVRGAITVEGIMKGTEKVGL